MINAISYLEIVKSANETLAGQPKTIVHYDSVDPLTEKSMAEINAGIKKHTLVAVLFCNPNTEFCKKEILDYLNYLHHRSGKYINIYCCGYGAYWPTSKYPDLKQITEIDGVQWYYSDNAFVSVVNEFERNTKWQYSGENELLLLDIIPSDDENKLNINDAIVCNLEKMKKDEAFSSARSLFENLIRHCSSHETVDAFSFSDTEGLNIAKEFLKTTFLKLLPKDLQAAYNKAESFAVKTI